MTVDSRKFIVGIHGRLGGGGLTLGGVYTRMFTCSNAPVKNCKRKFNFDDGAVNLPSSMRKTTWKYVPKIIRRERRLRPVSKTNFTEKKQRINHIIL